jgi:hypothetical protein
MLERRGEPTDTVPDAMMSALFEKHLRTVEAWLAAQPNVAALYVPYPRAGRAARRSARPDHPVPWP